MSARICLRVAQYSSSETKPFSFRPSSLASRSSKLGVDDATLAGPAATRSFVVSVLGAYAQSTAMILCLKDPLVAFVVACLPPPQHIRSARLRRFARKLGGSLYELAV